MDAPGEAITDLYHAELRLPAYDPRLHDGAIRAGAQSTCQAAARRLQSGP